MRSRLIQGMSRPLSTRSGWTRKRIALKWVVGTDRDSIIMMDRRIGQGGDYELVLSA